MGLLRSKTKLETCLTKGALKCIRGYQWMLSPVLHAFPGSSGCRFVPSCSAYALGAIEKHGLTKGSTLSLKRILRCHPFSRGGWDPVV